MVGDAYCLFAYDRSYFWLCSIDETIQSLEKRAEAFEAMHTDSASDPIPDPISILYTDEDDPFTIASDAQKPGHINTMSRLSWVACGQDIFVIELVARGFIRIERHGMWMPTGVSDATNISMF